MSAGINGLSLRLPIRRGVRSELVSDSRRTAARLRVAVARDAENRVPLVALIRADARTVLPRAGAPLSALSAPLHPLALPPMEDPHVPGTRSAQ